MGQTELVTTDRTVPMEQLHHAVLDKNLSEVQRLLSEEKVDVNMTTAKGDTALHLAAYVKDFDIVKMLLAHPDINVTSRNNFEMIPLHRATKAGSLKVVQALMTADLENGKSMNSQDDEMLTPLMYAVLAKHQDVVEYLLQNGGDVQIKDLCEHTAVDYAITGGDLSLLNLFKKYVKVRDCDLSFAVQSGNVPLYRWLIELRPKSDCNPKTRTILLRTAMMFHVDNRTMDVVFPLVNQRNVDDSVDEVGNTLMHYAVFYSNIDAAERLIRIGAQISIQNKLKETPINMLEQLNQYECATNLQVLYDQRNNNVDDKISNGSNQPIRSETLTAVNRVSNDKQAVKHDNRKQRRQMNAKANINKSRDKQLNIKSTEKVRQDKINQRATGFVRKCCLFQMLFQRKRKPKNKQIVIPRVKTESRIMYGLTLLWLAIQRPLKLWKSLGAFINEK